MKRLLVLRRVVGESMLPTLRPEQLVVGIGIGAPKDGQVVILAHGGLEKVKRIASINGETAYVLGDNAPASTDSRQFGRVPREQIIARVIWPRTRLPS
ncbi:MAG TPA: S26 family signal peptidase [Candidatus Saccharimonadales bacterium]|nr:S26 family signal peptidase [Candidatus Saccharimonadales bacterium]